MTKNPHVTSPDQPPSTARSLPWRRTFVVIFWLALISRLVVLLITLHTKPHNWLYSKGIEMGLLADSLVHGLGYSSPFGVPTGPTAFIAPGYPTLIAAVFLLFGSYSYVSAIVIMSGDAMTSGPSSRVRAASAAAKRAPMMTSGRARSHACGMQRATRPGLKL